jgi:hypothetical protein
VIITGAGNYGMAGWADDLAHAIASPVVFVADVGKDVALPLINVAGTIGGGAVRVVGGVAGGAASAAKGVVTTLHPNVVAPAAPSNLPLVLGIGGAALLVLVVAFSGRKREAEHAA